MELQYRAARGGLVRNADVSELLESFLVAAAVAFLAIRIYLALTDYPQLGGHGFHIAHMLWGGLLMLAALVSLIAFLGGRVRRIAAIIGGLGFGTFIDELGKFITSDDNYFYQPTIAIIYAIFVILYLVFQAIENHSSKSAGATLARALDMTTTAALSGFDAGNRRRALQLLDETNPADPVARSLREGILQVEPRPTPGPTALIRLVSRAQAGYDRIVQQTWFPALIVVLVVALVVTGLVSVWAELTRDPEFAPGQPSLTPVDLLKITAVVLANLLILIGLVNLRRSRLDAFVWFKRAVLVSLLLVQFFSFYEAGLTAAWGLLLNLALLAALNVAIRREHAHAESVPAPAMAR